jgi:hypothetical protein
MTLPYESAAVTRRAQVLMGSEGRACVDGYGSVYHRSWTEEECRAVFQPRDLMQWIIRVLYLESRQQAGLRAEYAPEFVTPDGELMTVLHRWRDVAVEEWGTTYITGSGVCWLAYWYRNRRRTA